MLTVIDIDLTFLCILVYLKRIERAYVQPKEHTSLGQKKGLKIALGNRFCSDLKRQSGGV